MFQMKSLFITLSKKELNIFPKSMCGSIVQELARLLLFWIQRQKDFEEMINTNLRGTYLCCKHIGKHMKVQNSGHIINLVSIAAKTAIPGCGGYAASKHGVLGLTRILQAELRTEGIQVTSVIPGSISSPFWDGIENKPDLEQMIPPDTLAAHLLGLIHQPPGAYVDEITIMPPLGIL